MNPKGSIEPFSWLGSKYAALIEPFLLRVNRLKS